MSYKPERIKINHKASLQGDMFNDLVEATIEKLKSEMKPIEVKLEDSSEDFTDVVVEDNKVTLNGYFKVGLGNYKILSSNIEHKVNTMLIGPTGLGKTELVINLAKVLNTPVTIFDMGTMTDAVMGLVGTHTITVDGDKTYSEFKKSRFSEVIQKPGIVLLDEISRASASANNLLFPVLDSRKELSMEYSFDNTEPIKVHPDCVFFATANMGSQYTGTHKLDRALLDRFMLIEVDALDKTDVISTLCNVYPKISVRKVQNITNTFFKINEMHEKYEISFNLSIRHIKNIASLVERGFSIYDGFVSICRGLGGKEGLKAIEIILKNEE